MRKLHLVGFTPDRKGLIFSARRGSKSGGFLVPLEDSLLESLAAEQRRRNGVDTDDAATAETSASAPEPARPGRPQSTLTPREMQSRLRAGRTIADVAAEAGVSTDWVERFAIPILAEQAQMVELARSLTYTRSRGGESALPLGASVAENLADRGVAMPDDLFGTAWSAYQLHDVVWIVRVRYRSRGRLQEAAWEVDVGSGHLTARNRLASELAFVEKGRRRRARQSVSSAPSEAALPAPDRPAPARSRGAGRRRTAAPTARPPAAKRAATRAAAPPRAPTKRPTAKRPTAKRPTAKRPTAKRPTAKRPTAKRTASKRPTVKRTASKRPAAKRVVTKHVASPAPTPPIEAPSAARPARSATGAEVRSQGTAVPPPLRVGTDGTPAPPSSGRVVSPTSGGSHPPEGPSNGQARSRSPVNRLAASRVTASRAAAGRLRGDRRPANPLPPEEPLPPRRTPRQSRTAQVGPGDGGRAAMTETVPPSPSSSPISLPAASPAAASPVAAEAVPPPAEDTDFEIDDLLEPGPPERTGRPVIAAQRAGAPGAPRPLRRASGTGRLSPWPVGTS